MNTVAGRVDVHPSAEVGAQGVAAHETATNTKSGAPFTAPLPLHYEAMGRYPELAKAGSPFNWEVLVRVERARVERPILFANAKWPLVLADDVAGVMQKVGSHGAGQIPSTGATVIGTIDWYAGHSAASFGKLAYAQQKLDRYSPDFELLSVAIFHATNNARRSHGLRPLAYLLRCGTPHGSIRW